MIGNIVPSSPGANLKTTSPTGMASEAYTPKNFDPHKLTSKFFRRYKPNQRADSETDSATSVRQYEPLHGIGTGSCKTEEEE
jgi:hypothetical protein